ncbi:Rieske (2Fe-2S) protein [Pontibacter russatus]|uniref:Rieske (2Fe-2S) protein n=1 Tax=Pontibacter russatus TaxID=2694929 RepID=UPI00137A80D4|nr:Rieske 2Fe-2S domain-containing protein [Pontibacter russatus]
MPQPDVIYAWHRVFSSEGEAKARVGLRKLHQLQLDGRDICFAHTAAGFFAVADACPHMGRSLSHGTTNCLNEVICPWHSYAYSLGSGRERDYRTRDAPIYPVEVRSDGVYIGIRQRPAGQQK